MGEKQYQPLQLSFNASWKVDFQGSRVTPDGGLVLVRELDERLALRLYRSRRKFSALKNLAGALPTDGIGFTLSVVWEVKMEIPVDRVNL